VKAAGGLTLAESESSAAVFGMPREAADSAHVEGDMDGKGSTDP
jgi:chemotaxis response regulator CheB